MPRDGVLFGGQRSGVVLTPEGALLGLDIAPRPALILAVSSGFALGWAKGRLMVPDETGVGLWLASWAG